MDILTAALAVSTATTAAGSAYLLYKNSLLSAALEHQTGKNKVGSVKNGAMIFTDMSGFTTVSEQQKPERMANFLYTVLSPALEIVRDNGGVVEGIQGDALLYSHQDAKTALEICIKVQEQLERSVLQCGKLGLNVKKNVFKSGATMGSYFSGYITSDPKKFDRLLLGTTINEASRLQSLTKIYNKNIICSKELYLEAGKPRNFKFLDAIIAKGSQKVIEIYTVPENLANWIHFEKAQEFYIKKDFVSAKKLFLAANEKIWANRCDFLQTQRLDNWSGVWRWLEK